MMDFIERRKVSRDPDMNAALPNEARHANQEHDIILFGDAIVRVLEINEKYVAYLDQLITKEKKKTEFWETQLSRVATGTFWAVWSAIVAACLYQAKEFFNG